MSSVNFPEPPLPRIRFFYILIHMVLGWLVVFVLGFLILSVTKQRVITCGCLASVIGVGVLLVSFVLKGSSRYDADGNIIDYDGGQDEWRGAGRPGAFGDW